MAGYPITMHIHDEAVMEIPSEDKEKTLDKVNALFGAPIPWAEGLHLSAAGFTSDYYMKD